MGRTDYHEILDEAEHMERCVAGFTSVPCRSCRQHTTHRVRSARVHARGRDPNPTWNNNFSLSNSRRNLAPAPRATPSSPSPSSITPAHHPNLTSSTHASTTIQRRSTKASEVWDLEAEAARLNLVLDDLPMEEKAWDRAVNVAYRKAALRAHPDKHPPDQRDAAEANFKRLNRANKLLLRVGKAIRDEAESGDGEFILIQLSYGQID